MADTPTNERPREISVSRLLLDQKNARLGVPQPDQTSTELALAEYLGPQLFEMANDILEFGIDPSASLLVTSEGAPPGKYRVLEGNRRTLTVKALLRPKIISEVLTPARLKRFEKLSEQFKENPIRSLRCVVFGTEEEADHWIELRHTGANNGAGLVEWDPDEQDRWKSRRGGSINRKEAGQVLDFVDKVYPPRPEDNKRIFSTLQRIVVARNVREKLGLEIKAGIVYTYFPGREILRPLAKIVADLRSGQKKVTDVYHASDRDKYMAEFTASDLPDPNARLNDSVKLSELSVSGNRDGGGADTGGLASGADGVGNAGQTGNADGPSGESAGSGGHAAGEVDPSNEGKTTSGARRSRVKPSRPRMAVIPNTCNLWIAQSRINSIYRELLTLDIEDYSNACAVTLRVFVELSVDHHIAAENLMSESERRSTPLAKRMKELAGHLRAGGRIDEQLERAIVKVADGVGLFSASTVTFNQYVHNAFAYPHPSELRAAWDELEPFMLALWVK